NAVQIPSAFAAPLAINPHERLVLRAGNEVVAGDVVAVPPAGLDPLRTDEQLERPVVVRHGSDLRERAWRFQQPKWALAEIELQLLLSCIGDHACALRAMLRSARDAAHRFGAETRPPPLDQVLPLAGRFALLEWGAQGACGGVAQ